MAQTPATATPVPPDAAAAAVAAGVLPEIPKKPLESSKELKRKVIAMEKALQSTYARLAMTEKQIFDLERSYLEETRLYGNVLSGWDKYIDARKKVKARGFGGYSDGAQMTEGEDEDEEGEGEGEEEDEEDEEDEEEAAGSGSDDDDEAPPSLPIMPAGMMEMQAPRVIQPEERLFSLGSVTSPASKEIEEKKDRDKDGSSSSSKRQKSNNNSNGNSGDSNNSGGGSSSYRRDKDSDNSQKKETDAHKKKERDGRTQKKREEQQGERTPAPRGRPRLNKGRDASGGGGSGSSPSIKPSSPKEQRLGGRPSMSPRPPGRPSKNSQVGGRNTPESRDASSMAMKRKHR